MDRYSHTLEDDPRFDARHRCNLSDTAVFSPALPQIARLPERADRLTVAFASFAFIATTGFFKSIGLLSAAFAVLYMAGAFLAARAALCAFNSRGQSAPLKLPVILIVCAFPMLCLLSTFWSVDAAGSLRNALQLCFTAAFGIVIGRTLEPRVVLRTLAASMFVCVLVSAINVFVEVVPAWSQDDFIGASAYLVGVYNQKNLFGYVLCLLAWSALYVGLEKGRYGIVIGIIVAIVMVPFVRATGSSTAAILYALILTMPLFHFMLHATRSLLATAVLGMTVLILGFVVIGFAGTSIVDLVLEAVGKDASLTGRTAMWDIAFKQLSQYPFTGVGYQVFWSDPAFVTSVALIQATVFESVTNFHNAFIEAAVGTGILGALALVMLPASVFFMSLERLSSSPTPLATGTCYLVVVLVTRTFVEASLAFQHQLDFLLLSVLATSLGSSTRKVSDSEAHL